MVARVSLLRVAIFSAVSRKFCAVALVYSLSPMSRAVDLASFGLWRTSGGNSGFGFLLSSVAQKYCSSVSEILCVFHGIRYSIQFGVWHVKCRFYTCFLGLVC